MTTTAFFVTVCMIVIAIYDAISVYRTGLPSSISKYMQRMGFQAPAFTFALGFLAGHFFGYMAPDPLPALAAYFLGKDL
jgi:presenilin-like A22 family membrane protease